MGTTYCPRNKKIEEFDVNSSGRMLLGYLHEKLGLPIYEDPARRFFADTPPFAPYQAKAAAARKMSQQLSIVKDEQILEILQNPTVKDLWGGTPQEFIGWVRSWQKFLLNCSGYQVPG